MKKLYFILSISIIALLTSCTNPKKNIVYDLSNSSNLLIEDTLVRFDNKIAIGVSIKDSMAFIIQAQSDTCITVLNIKSKIISKSFGLVGHGPEDVISPSFIASIDGSNNIYLIDTNTKKMLKVEKRNKNEYFLKEFIRYPNEIFPSSNLNYSKNYIVGRKIGSENNKMFYIFNQKTRLKIEVDPNPLMTDLKDVNYFCAPNLALNTQKKKIVVGMYFFDMFHLYDLEGNHLKTFYFSDNYIPKVDKKNRVLDMSEGCKGINRVFPTKNYCYLLRYIEKPVFENGVVVRSNNELFLVKIDWDGNLIKSYKFKDEIIGQFYVDEINKKVFAIRHVVESKNHEFYDVVSYLLN